MRGLTIIVATGDAGKFRAALTLAISQAALGGTARVYCHEASVALLARETTPDTDSAKLEAAGLPDRPALVVIALESGVDLIACQTGLTLTGLTLPGLIDGVEAGGLMGIMATLGDDRLVSF